MSAFTAPFAASSPYSNTLPTTIPPSSRATTSSLTASLLPPLPSSASSSAVSLPTSRRQHCNGFLGSVMGSFSSRLSKGHNSASSSPVMASGSTSQSASVSQRDGRLISKSGYDVTPMTKEEIEVASKGLTRLQRDVVFNHGTERAFTGKTVNGYSHDNKNKGIYVSAVSGLPLFSSEQKYNSGTGWPSFWGPIDKDHIIERTDYSIPFMPRTEIIDVRSGAHLGHVFNDGPRPTGKRYCMNAAALKFIPEGGELPLESRPLPTTQDTRTEQ